MDLGNRISSKRPRVNAAVAAALAAPDWSSLDSDLVGRVADVFLAANDVDYYLSLRAVCRNWRAATVDPRGPDEPRFRLRRWIMLADRAEDSRLFLNLDTGRFLWRDLPAFRGHVSLGTADGLYLLQAPASDGGACILNPFTGYLVQLPTTVALSEHRFSWSPLMLLMFLDACDGESFDHDGESFWQGADFFAASPSTSTVAFQGCIYTLDSAGSIVVMDRSRYHTDPDDWITTIGGVDFSATWDKLHGGGLHHDWTSFILASLGSFFVDNGGELLLVSGQYGRFEVYRVDIARKALVPIKSIGDRAIFLGSWHSLSVRTPAFEGNCVYCSYERHDKRVICVYHLEDGRTEELQDPHLGPLSLQQVLIAYCRVSRTPW